MYPSSTYLRYKSRLNDTLSNLSPVPGISAEAEQIKFTESSCTALKRVRFLVTSYKLVMVFLATVSLPSITLLARGPPSDIGFPSVRMRVWPSYIKDMVGAGEPEAVLIKVMSVCSLTVNC